MRANRSMPRAQVIPVLAYADVGRAVDWLCDVFGFTLRIRIGDHRAQLNVGDGAVVVAGLPAPGRSGSAEAGESGRTVQGPVPHSVMVRVEDVDRHYLHAKEGGARILEEPANYPYGKRQYTAADSRRAPLDVLAVDRRCGSRGVGRHVIPNGLARICPHPANVWSSGSRPMVDEN